MKTKDSSPEEQTESPEQGHQEVANLMASVAGHAILKCSNEKSSNMNIYVYFYLISTDLKLCFKNLKTIKKTTRDHESSDMCQTERDNIANVKFNFSRRRCFPFWTVKVESH